MADAKVKEESSAINYVKGDVDKADFLGNPVIDSLVTIVQNLGMYVWTSRRRLYIIEAMMAKKLAITESAIQQYVPTAEEVAKWESERDEMIRLTYAPFLRSGGTNYASATAQGLQPRTLSAHEPPVGGQELDLPRGWPARQ